MSKLKPRMVWCPTCGTWYPAPATDENICVHCGRISTRCKCIRCGFEWTPRTPIKSGSPKQCYKCNSPYFDRPYSKNTKKTTKA